MPYFKAKMHQIQFRLGAYSAPPDPLVEYKGAFFYGKGRKGEGGEGERPLVLACTP